VNPQRDEQADAVPSNVVRIGEYRRRPKVSAPHGEPVQENIEGSSEGVRENIGGSSHNPSPSPIPLEIDHARGASRLRLLRLSRADLNRLGTHLGIPDPFELDTVDLVEQIVVMGRAERGLV